jgi:hypothetical protein
MSNGKLKIVFVPDDGLARARSHGGLEIVDEHFIWHAAEKIESTAVTIQPRQHLHVGRKSHKQRSRPRHNGDEYVQFCAMCSDIDCAKFAPIDLHLLTSFTEVCLMLRLLW